MKPISGNLNAAGHAETAVFSRISPEKDLTKPHETTPDAGSECGIGVVGIPLPGGLVALVDADDYPRVADYSWHAKRNLRLPGKVYVQAALRKDQGGTRKKETVSLHRLLMDAKPGEIVDHRNGDPLDNRRENLRVTTARGNAMNITRSKRQKAGGYKGVSWNKNAGKWEAGIAIGELRANGKRKRVYLGLFNDAEQAARAYDAAALEHYGEFAALNFPANDGASEDDAAGGGRG